LMRRTSVCLLLLMAAGCVVQENISPNTPTLLVHAVLDANATTQYAVVQRNDGISRTQTTERGAQVTIAGPDGRVMLAEEIPNTGIFLNGSSSTAVTNVYRFDLEKLGVVLVPGGEYHLLIVAGRDTVRGTTVMPRFQSGITPSAPEIFRRRDTLDLHWSPVPGAASYQVSVSSSRGVYTTFADSTISLPGQLSVSDVGTVFNLGLSHQVIVSAVDRNFYDYFRRTSDLFTGSGLIIHLEGAVGVFGSIARVSVRVLNVGQ
jgi:hypothetical protein